MTTQPEPYRFVDAYGDDLYVGWHADDDDRQVLVFETDGTIHVPLADVEQVVDAIRAQARQVLGTTTCTCGEPTTLGTVHRVDGPCYISERAASGCDCGPPPGGICVHDVFPTRQILGTTDVEAGR